MRTHISSEHGEDAGDKASVLDSLLRFLEHGSGVKGLAIEHRSDQIILYIYSR